MIGPGTGVRVYVACGVTDMRKEHRQVVGDLRNDSRGARSQAALSSRVMSSQIQWASALVWR
jgi:hypothetical protein